MTQASIWLVDPSGEGDFTDIQAAIDAAQSGDVILVNPGRYQPFDLSKGVMIRSTSGQFTIDHREYDTMIEISDIAAGERAGLSGLRGNANDNDSLPIYAHDCPGELIFENIEIGGGFIPGDALFDIQGCDNVSITGLNVLGPTSMSAPASVRITSSHVRISGSTIMGAYGWSSGCGGGTDGCPGGHGLRVGSSFVVLARTSVSGGDGCFGVAPWDGDRGNGGNGGHAVYCQNSRMFIFGSPDDLLQGGNGGNAGIDYCGIYHGCGGNGGDGFTGSSVTVSRVTSAGGFAGHSGDDCRNKPHGGVPYRGDVTHFDLIPFLDSSSSVDPGTRIDLLVETAEPYSPVVLLASDLGGFIDIPGNDGPPFCTLPGGWFLAFPAGASDGAGHLSIRLVISEDPAIQGFPLNIQAVALSSQGPLLSNAPTRVLGPADNDCNRNGIPDSDDIASGRSHDCDENGIPDECQDENEDCNGNGIWDRCDIHWGNSYDRDRNGIPDECEENLAIYVDDDAAGDPGPGDPDISDPLESGTLSHPFDSIQEAIDAAIAPLTVVVADGFYAGRGNRDIDFQGKKLLMRSENGPARTVIDAGRQGRGFIFQSGETPDSRVVGFTITGGQVTEGGGMLIVSSSPSVENCWIIDNIADGPGGGVFCNQGSPRLQDCHISGNRAGEHGGGCGTRGGSVEFVDTWITHNVTGRSGGGVGARESTELVFKGCEISHNVTSSAYKGGGVWAFDVGILTMARCVIRANEARNGGGVYSSAADGRLIDCVVADNRALNGAGVCGALHLQNVTLVRNRADRDGGGMYAEQGTLAQVIAWGNQAGDKGSQVYLARDGSVGLTYCDIQDGRDGIDGGTGVDWGEGNISSDPRLSRHGNGNFHLSANSPCIDAGDPDFEPGPEETDIDGEQRVTRGIVDIGADESRSWSSKGPRNHR